MTILKEDIKAAGWPEKYITHVTFVKNTLCLTVLELKKAKSSFRYETKHISIKGISHLAMYIRNNKERVVSEKHLGEEEPSCVNVPGLYAMVKGHPFDDLVNDGWFWLDFTFEADSLEMQKSDEVVKVSLKDDISSMPTFRDCFDTLDYFKQNLKARESKRRQTKNGKPISATEIIDILSFHELIVAPPSSNWKVVIRLSFYTYH